MLSPEITQRLLAIKDQIDAIEMPPSTLDETKRVAKCRISADGASLKESGVAQVDRDELQRSRPRVGD